jgi:IS1 family transposase
MCIIGLKKTAQILKDNYQILELDELYWFLERKAKTATRENVYVMTMVSREPRQIVGFDAARDKSPERIQAIVDSAPEAEDYATDGYFGYIDVVYPGKHIRNIHDKSNTFTVEGVNADLRHYIPILARRSRCFPRKLETLQAVLEVFVEAYNRFGEAKAKCRVLTEHKQGNAKKHLHKFRDVGFSILDYL